MKKIKIISFLIILLFVVLNLAKSQIKLPEFQSIENPKFDQMRQELESVWKDIPDTLRKGGWKQFKRWEYFWETRLNPDGTFPDAFKVYQEYKSKNFEKKGNYLQATNTWKELGPINPPVSGGDDHGIGRVNIVRFHPTKNKIVWAGSASGGVWYSGDYGKTWKTFPFTQFLSLGVSDIQFAPSNPDIVYVATGDANGIGGGGGNSYSIGIIKTTDAGATWYVTGLSSTITNRRITAKLWVHPSNPNIVVAATGDGIYKTTDGGVTWINKNSSNYFKDIVGMPGNSNILYAASYGSTAIYKSSDMGETWRAVHNVSGPQRIALAVSEDNPNKVYALCATSAFHSFRVSTNQGETWQTLSSNDTKTPNILGRDDGTGSDKNVGQGWYDLTVAVAPWNQNEVFVGGINIWKSTNGGTNWEMVTHWTGNYSKPLVHADIHHLNYDSYTGYLWSTNDGGVDYTTDGGKRWISVDNGMSITQFYRLGASYTDENLIIAGSQDNGTSLKTKNGWEKAYGGDGMECIIDYTTPSRRYLSIYNGYLFRTGSGTYYSQMLSSSITGESGAWVTPYIISPINPDILFAGYRNVWRTYDNGRNWRKISNFSSGQLRSLAAAPSDSNTLYAATLDVLYATYDGGKTWTNISNGANAITYIAVDPKNPKRIWITNGGYSEKQKVFEYDGSKWKNLSGNLPNIPVNTIAYQNNSPDRLYIGTDIGVFVSDYGSANWEIYGDGLPNLIISELEIHYPTGKMRAASYGRGIWEVPIIDCNLPEPKLKIVGETSFCQGGKVILEVDGDYENFVWSNGDKSKSITITESGTYSYSISDNKGCKASSKAVDVNVYPSPEVNIKIVGKLPCEGDSINLELQANVGFSKYEWSNGDSTRRIKINKIGEYIVNAYTTNGCKSTSKISIGINPIPSKPTITRLNPILLQSSEAVAYQWFMDDNLLEGENDRILEIKELGIYTVKVFDENGCANISDAFDIISDVQDDKRISFSVVPNPSPGIYLLNVINPNESLIEIEVTNLLGEKVYNLSQLSKPNSNFMINLNSVSKGIYYLKIKIGGFIGMQKLIKE